MTIENTEFARNGMGNGCSVGGCTHNLYIPSSVDKLVFQYNWSHDIVTDGHLLKSRAQSNFILYNRITGQTGHESYCVDIPQGGLVVMVGNLIEQGPNPDNFTLLTWGEEGIVNADKRVFVANNTFVNDSGHGTFINVAAGGSLTANNNLFVGARHALDHRHAVRRQHRDDEPDVRRSGELRLPPHGGLAGDR